MKMRAVGIEATACETLDAALALSGAAAAAKESVAVPPRVLVAGSLFLAGEALLALDAFPWPIRPPDANEMFPWLRSFIGRIVELHIYQIDEAGNILSANRMLERRFWNDVRDLCRLYDMPGNVGQEDEGEQDDTVF